MYWRSSSEDYMKEQRELRNIRAHGGLRRRNPYGISGYRRNPRSLCSGCGAEIEREPWETGIESEFCGKCNSEYYASRNEEMEDTFQSLRPGDYPEDQYYRRNPGNEVEIIFKMNLKTGKKDIIIDVKSSPDALPHEHERDHKKIVEQLIGQGLIGAAEIGEIKVKRGGKAPAPLKEGKKEEPPEKKGIATRRRRNPDSILTSQGYDGNYALVSIKTNKPLKVGQTVKSGRDVWTLDGGRAPHKPGSEGKIWVRDERGNAREYYASVIDAKWLHESKWHSKSRRNKRKYNKKQKRHRKK